MSGKKIYLIFLLFLVLAVYLFFKDGWEAWQQLKKIEFLYIFYALLINMLCVSLDFLNWFYYLKLLLSKKITWSLKKSIAIHLAGFSVDILPAKVGTFSRAVLLKHLYNIPKRRGFAIQASALLTDLMAALVVSGITALIAVEVVEKNLINLWIILLLFFGIAIIVIKRQALGIKKLFTWLFNTFLKASHQESIQGAKKDFLSLFTLSNLKLTLSIKLFSWCLLGCSFYLLLIGFGYSVNLPQTILAVSLSAIVGGLSMLPGGLGTTDLSLLGFAIVWGIPAEQALLIVFCYRLISFWYLLFIGNLVSQFILLSGKQQLEADNKSL